MSENSNPNPVVNASEDASVVDPLRQPSDVIDISAQEPVKPASESSSSGIKTRLAVGLTIAATAIANVAAGTPKFEKVDVPLGGSDGERAKKNPSPAERVSIPSEQWAERFADDKAAGELTAPTELTKVTQKIDELIGMGKEIESIDIQGFASAEESTPDRSAGLQEDEPKNVELAGVRLSAFTEMLTKELEDKNINIPEITEKTPIEDHLSDDEVALTTNLTEKYGYKDSQTMIEAYNRDENVPDEVRESLDSLLRSERKVVVTIHSSGEESEQSAEQADNKMTIPVPLFLIIPIPKISRRRKSSAEAVAGMGSGEAVGEKGQKPLATARKDEAFRTSPPKRHISNFEKVAQRRKQPRPHNEGLKQRKIHSRKRDKGGSTRSTRG